MNNTIHGHVQAKDIIAFADPETINIDAGDMYIDGDLKIIGKAGVDNTIDNPTLNIPGVLYVRGDVIAKDLIARMKSNV